MTEHPNAFDAAWLDLREPADVAARDPELLREFASVLSSFDPARIIDLGSGTGSTMRAVRSAIPAAQWHLVDQDAALLAEAARRDSDATTEGADLAADIEAVLARESDAITASALIDLVSRDWIERLVRHARGRPLYIALTYDGREVWDPAHRDDAVVLDAFRSHQQTDKGFGPSLGPEAADVFVEIVEREGGRVIRAPSPWRLTRGPLVAALADGIADAAIEIGIDPAIASRWRQDRRSSESCLIGHEDVLALF